MTASLFKKVCLLGDFAVGKTSLVRRYVDNQFSDTYLTTIGVKISRKLITVEDSQGCAQGVQLILWDLEGREDFLGDSRSYLKGASGAVIVGDVSRPNTIEHCQRHINAFLEENPDGHIVVACNKIDLLAGEHQPALPLFSNPRLLETRFTSAKDRLGVDELILTLSRKFLFAHE